MRASWAKYAFSLGLILAAGLVGCDKFGAEGEKSPEEAAQEALGMEEGDSERTIEAQERVNVIKETTVVDRETGKVLSSEKEVTPVTVTKEKEIDTDVDVDKGATVPANQ